jgi:hypothetical protein
MFDIQHNGFVARLSVDGDLIRGEVLDTHESLIIEGQSIREIKEDFAIKIESYCARCKRRGLLPFNNSDGISTVERQAKFIENSSASSGPGMRAGLEWMLNAKLPRNHSLFYSAKAHLMLEQLGTVKNSAFQKIPVKLRLPIDDFIEILRSRRRAPSLAECWRTSEGEKNLLLWLRLYLLRAFQRVSNADPWGRHLDRDSAVEFLTHARRLEEEGTSFIDRYADLDGFPRFSRGLDGETCHKHFLIATVAQNYLNLFLESLSMMMSWAHTDLDRVAPELGGRPRLQWKHDFVATMGELWELISLRKPSSKADSLFADLVDAAWRCGGDDMPSVEWGETIRTFCKGWNKQKGGETPQGHR